MRKRNKKNITNNSLFGKMNESNPTLLNNYLFYLKEVSKISSEQYRIYMVKF